MLFRSFSRLLTGFDIATEGETGVFFHCIRTSKNIPSALNKWCKQMRRNSQGTLVDDLLQLKQYVHYLEERQDSLQDVLAQKKWLHEQMEYSDWEVQPPESRPLERVLAVLKFLPGVTKTDLLKWNSGEGAKAVAKETMDFASALSKEWINDGPSSWEKCKDLGIDPSAPTDEEPNSERKELILQARLELDMPLYLPGDRKVNDPVQRGVHADADDSLAEIDDDDEWELQAELAFHRTMKRKETLQKKVDDLISL